MIIMGWILDGMLQQHLSLFFINRRRWAAAGWCWCWATGACIEKVTFKTGSHPFTVIHHISSSTPYHRWQLAAFHASTIFCCIQAMEVFNTGQGIFQSCTFYFLRRKNGFNITHTIRSLLARFCNTVNLFQEKGSRTKLERLFCITENISECRFWSGSPKVQRSKLQALCWDIEEIWLKTQPQMNVSSKSGNSFRGRAGEGWKWKGGLAWPPINLSVRLCSQSPVQVGSWTQTATPPLSKAVGSWVMHQV